MTKRLLVALIFWSSAGLAQDADDIVVTGERIPRTVDETASSVYAITADGLSDLAAPDRVEQVLALIPNLQLGSGGEGPTIRGQDTTGVLRDLPAFLGGNRPRTTLQVDGRAVSYNEFVFGATPIWDVERIEVFRSPQTTTQGANSIAGAIFIETRDPSFEWEGRARVLAGDYDTWQTSAAVSGGLAPDQLAIRLTGDVRRQRTSSQITSPALGIDPNRDDNDLGRLKLLFTPTALPGLRVTAIATHTRSQAPQIEGLVVPYRARRDPGATYGIFRTQVDALTLRGSFERRTLLVSATASVGSASFRRFAPPGFGEARNRANDRSTEVTGQWRPSVAFDLVAGSRLSSNHLAQSIDLSAALLGKGGFRDVQRSLGVFGEASLKPVPQLILTAGGRYQRDRQVRNGSIGSTRPATLSYDRSFARFLPKLSLTYAPSNAFRAGVLVQRAYNPGGTTLNVATGIADPFEAETLWDYEGFVRAVLPGGLRISANLFRYAITNAQRSLLREVVTAGGTVFLADIDNAPSAKSSGAEIEVRYRPAARVQIDAGVGLLRTRLTRTPSATDPLSGKAFQRSPHVTASTRVAWSPTADLRLSAAMRYTDAYFSDDANDPLRRVPASATADVQARWSRGAVSVSAYLRNLTNKLYLTYIFAPATRRATAGDPREFGLAAELKF